MRKVIQQLPTMIQLCLPICDRSLKTPALLQICLLNLSCSILHLFNPSLARSLMASVQEKATLHAELHQTQDYVQNLKAAGESKQRMLGQLCQEAQSAAEV